MPTESRPEITRAETAGCLEPDEVYRNTVLHAVAAPVARILLIGAFASQRHNSYPPWSRWALYPPEVASPVLSAAAAQRRCEERLADFSRVGGVGPG